jgi:hypothetical protein
VKTLELIDLQKKEIQATTESKLTEVFSALSLLEQDLKKETEERTKLEQSSIKFQEQVTQQVNTQLGQVQDKVVGLIELINS